MLKQQLRQTTKANQSDLVTKPQDEFIRHVVHESTLASNDVRAKNFDLQAATHINKSGFLALEAETGLQSMLAAQMLSIHKLQQKTMLYANTAEHMKLQQYYTNAAIKLSNCFVQQANMLAKLQGIAGQRIIVERVDVHQGGQAIVGNIQGGMDNKEKI